MYRILVFLTIIVSILSCSKNSNNDEFHNNSFAELIESTLNLEIDSVTPPTTRYLDIYFDKKSQQSYLVYLNTNGDDLQFYNMSTKQLDFKIEVEKEGINKIHQIYGFYIKNLDSIFVTNYRLNVVLMNSKGDIIRKYGDELKLPYSVWNYKRMEMLDDQHLIVHQAPMRWASRPKFWDENRTFIVNTSSGVYDSVYTYHGKYKDEIYGQALGSFWKFIKGGNGNFVYSFNFDENLYVTDFKTETLYSAKSRNFDIIPPMSNPEAGGPEIEHLNNNNSYGPILYDSQNKLYYRFAMHKAKRPYPENDDYMSGKPFSIIILDENFNIIKETGVFDEGTFYYRNSFVYDGKLYISNNNFSNKDMDEDFLSFSVLDFSKK